ncbi:hypothetical protein F5B22DRAFT_644364 [Xylaria bambusicola]|uniref:uncharacterized protein n=1 Tax=Xylaria bambusicola TaxID=326684 RepID=UPI0020084984|nr:uncharacterized protein F5B22DRAFT_644364 [Xylaria bambusicola]KAI0521113.1 hypothetical protein F5B22DRAFT_644364 [Xylaria bambusicola]
MGFSSKNDPETAHPLPVMTPDNAGEGYNVRGAIPPYNTAKDAGSVPDYTREYLGQLPAAIEAHVRLRSDEMTYHLQAVARYKRALKVMWWTMGAFTLILLILAAFLLVMITEKGRYN